MRKKGGKQDDGQKTPKKEIALKKEKEKRSWKGRWVTFVASVTEDGKPAAHRSVLFFCGEENIGEDKTGADGEATCSHLLKSGRHTVTATYDGMKSNAVAVEIEKPATESTVIKSRKIATGSGSYDVVFQVLDKGKPVSGAILTVLEHGVGRPDLPPTDENGMTLYKVTVKERTLTCIIKLARTNVSIWKTFHNHDFRENRRIQ